MNDVADYLGWLPLPAPPASLAALVERTDRFLAGWWLDGDRDALDALAATWLELLGRPDFGAADEDFRLASHDRAGMAMVWQASEDGAVPRLDAARRHIDLVLAARPGWLADVRYHSAIIGYNRALLAGDDGSAVAAVAELRTLIAELPADECRLRHRCLDVLGRTLLWMQRRDQNAVDLDEVVALSLEALRGFPPEAPYRAIVVTTAASALRDRFKITGRIADLDLAIELLNDNANLRMFRGASAFGVSLLGILLRERYLRTGNPDDLERALDCHARTVAATKSTQRNYPLVLTNQGNALLSAFHLDGDVDRLDQAIQAQAEAVRVTSPRDWYYPSRLNNLANSLSTAFDVTGDTSYLDRAVNLYREAVTLASESDYDLPSRHYNLANALRDRGRRRDRRDTTNHYRLACRMGLERSPEWAIDAAVAWGSWAGALGNWRQAAEAYEWGTRAIELLFKRQNTRAHKESWLRQAQGLPARAAHAYARLGRPEEAVLIQERGRTLLLAETLRQQQAGVLAIPDVVAAAGDCPLVYISPADQSGVALVIDPVRAAVRTVYLPGATALAVGGRVRLLVAAYRAREHDPAGWLGTVDAIGRWVQVAVLGPVLQELTRGRLDQASGLTVVPGGQLAMLPLHLAWEPGPYGRRYAQDQIAISYAPSAQALHRRDNHTVHSALIIDEPAPVSASRLPWSWVECAAVVARIERTTTLRGAEATRAAVLGQLRRHDVVHLSCHGIGRPDSALDSALHMANDEPLTLRDVIGLAPPGSGGPRLVMLSACESDQAGRDLPDEVVSFPTGLLQAGCRGVIATQWSVSSVATALLVAAFYQRWSGSGNPAQALSSAQRWLRESTNADLAACLQPDRSRDAIGLPADAARPLWMLLRRREPNERSFAHPTEWAAFAHVGV